MNILLAPLLSLLALLAAVPAFAQQPRLSNANVQTRSAAAGLERELRSLMSSVSGAAWVGYAAPMIPGEHNMCCYSSCCSGCSLEGRKNSDSTSANRDRVRLEGPSTLYILYRIEQGKVGKIRTFSEDCELDAGGLTFYWLTDVRPAESIALLSNYATAEDKEGSDGRKLSDAAVSAIAFHNDSQADRALESFVATTQSEALRGRTAFWLGNARGRRGYEILRGMLKDDPSSRVRDKVIFALTQSKEPAALQTIIDAAKGDSSSHVRGQALFWLAQKAGQKASEAISQAIENDPETDVKKKAVFALSQMPKDEGIPRLIEVARNNRNAEVRKQAMFWLGQSHDARALAFFEQILLK
jgi:hypothetical protein